MKLFKIILQYIDMDDDLQTEHYIVEAETAPKAKYKCFKEFHYDEEMCEGIHRQWSRFFLPNVLSVSRVHDEPITKTWEQIDEETKRRAEEAAKEWDERYPIGTEVLFQGDGKDAAIVTRTRSKAQRYGTYNTIFLEGVSGCYHLKDTFVRPLCGNEDVKVLR